MDEAESLSHTKWECKYHVVFIPKMRRKRGESRLGAVMTDDDIAWLKCHCGNAHCVSIEGVGHLLHLQDQGQTPVLTAMLAFLDRI